MTPQGRILCPYELKENGENPLESSPILYALKDLKLASETLVYWPEAAVLAVAAPAPFGMLR